MNTGRETLEVMNEAQWYNKWVFSFIEKHLSGEILEVGTGIGNFAEMFSKKGNVTAIDIDEEYVNELKKVHKNIDVGYGDIEKGKYFFGDKKFDVGYGDIEKGKYFFGDKKFDSIVSLNVVEHIKNDKDAINNMYKLLKKGGKIILLVPAHMQLYSNFDKKLGHFRRYSKGEVEKLLKLGGFESSTIRYFNWWGAIGWFFFMKLTGSDKMSKPPVRIFDYLAKLLLFPEKIIRIPFGLSIIAISKKK